jgi:hypothetical protein
MRHRTPYFGHCIGACGSEEGLKKGKQQQLTAELIAEYNY